MLSHSICAIVLLVAVSGETQFAQVGTHGGMVRRVSKDAEVHVLTPLTASGPFANSSDALKSLDLIYDGHASHAFWNVKQPTKSETQMYLGIPGDMHSATKALTYGEILPSTIMQLLQKVGARPGQKYIDLGSGTGKTVVAAWLLGLDATGVELVQNRWGAACKALTTSKQLGFRSATGGPQVSFVHGNILKQDFSDADIVFVDTAMFSKDMLAGLGKAVSRMKMNSKIISSTGLPGKGLRFDEKVVGPSSRSAGTTWTIQTVVSPLVTGSVAASLIRQEPPARPGHLHKELHRTQGPIVGNTHIATEAGAHGSNTCMLAQGVTTGMAARLAKRTIEQPDPLRSQIIEKLTQPTETQQ